MRTLLMAGILVLIGTTPLAADSDTDSVPRTEKISEEDAEVIANLEFLENFEFFKEEVALSDDYEVLEQWEGNGNEQ